MSTSISVVVFVRNCVGTIDRALASVTAANQPPVELIVLDGGSTDGTVEIIRRYEDKIAFWRSYPDGSSTNAINEGVRRANGEVICLLAGDDWLESSALSAVVREFAADRELDVLSCGTRTVRVGSDGHLDNDAVFISRKVLEFTVPNIVRHPLTLGRFFRRRVYERLGGFNNRYVSSDDLDFLLRACVARVKAKVLPQLTYTYLRHSQSRTLGANSDILLAMSRDNVQIAVDFLTNADLRPEERKALIGLHGRASAHAARILLMRGEFTQARQALSHAMSVNWLWPIWVFIWYGSSLMNRIRLF